MAVKDNYSFEPVGSVDTGTPVPSAPESYYNEDTDQPSTTAIVVGCGLVGWVLA